MHKIVLYVRTIALYLLVALFLYAGMIKLLHYAQFIRDINNQVFPLWMKQGLIVALPAIELLTSVLLMTSRLERVGLVVASTILFLFTMYTVLVMADVFPRRPCSCGGIINMLTWPQHLVFNCFFLSLAILCVVTEQFSLYTSTTVR